MEGEGKEDCVRPFNEMAEYLLAQPESSVPNPLHDRAIFDVVGGWK